jgi:hypothetical protein
VAPSPTACRPVNEPCQQRRRPGFLLLVLALYVFLAFGYAHLMPMWEAPDETAHYLYVLAMAREGQPPTLDETYEALQPPTYYWLAGQALRLLEKVDPALVGPYRPPLSPRDALTRYDWTPSNYRFLWDAHLLRWFNIALGLATLIFLYYGAGYFIAELAVPQAVLVFCALLPQFLHISASVSNDPLAYLAGAGLFWSLGRLSRDQPPLWGLATLTLLALILPIAVKLTILPLSLAVLAGVAWRARPLFAGRWPRSRWLVVGAGVLFALTLPMILLASNPDAPQWRTFWLRVAFIRPDFFDEPLLWEMLAGFIRSLWGRLAWRGVGLPEALTLVLTVLALAGWLAALRWLFPKLRAARYWPAFLFVSTLPLAIVLLAGLASPWWRVPASAVLLASLAALLVWRRGRRVEPGQTLNPARQGFTLVWLAALLALLMIGRNSLSTRQFEGRFLFPTLGPILLLITSGWVALLPRRAVPYLPYLLLAGLLTLNFYLWFAKVIPIYYQPFLD